MNDIINKDNLTIPAVFDAQADKRPAHPAIIYLGTRYSYLKVKTLALPIPGKPLRYPNPAKAAT